MPTPTLEEPTTKVTLRIYTKDYELLQNELGQGQVAQWIRDLIRLRLNAHRRGEYDRT